MFPWALALLVLAASAFATTPPIGTCMPLSTLNFTYPPVTADGVKAHVIYKNLTNPRAMRWDKCGNLLVVERNTSVSALKFRNDANCVGWEKHVLVANASLNHGLEIWPKKGGNQYLYASSMENLFRWEYNCAALAVVGQPATLIWNMTNPGMPYNDHVTRTLLLEPPVGGESQGIIVSRGSGGNGDNAAIDPTTGRAQIHWFSLKNVPSGKGWAWGQGKILSWGNRNGVGIAFSKDGNSLWEVENSSDNLMWHGVDVHQDNPAEEMNLIPLKDTDSIPLARKFYGYPNCFTVWNSTSVPKNATSTAQFTFPTGDQFSVIDPPNNPTDAWCADQKNVVRPSLSFQAHSAPLDIVFYKEVKKPSDKSLCNDWVGDAFVSFHGSWDRDIPTGFKVVRIPMKEDGSCPKAPPNSQHGYETVLSASNVTSCYTEGCIRPVGLLFDPSGQLIMSSDATGEIIAIQGSPK
ncbi:hypothetical protein RhiJN_25240 [Ceratobasidium sp. AG-Ba]|nr:hypothetical protein RhiJN_25240 [Ceratobasidium sp. AG-Ba]